MSISPELALAAAAAIRDKALHDQTKELLELRRQLSESRKVEITGSNGQPVYAVGQFEDGNYKDKSEVDFLFPFIKDTLWWDVRLTMCEENRLHLRNMQQLEVRLGGIIYCTTSIDEVQGHFVMTLDSNYNSPREGGRDVLIPILSGKSYGGDRNAMLSLDLRGMPEPPYMMLKSAVSYNQAERNFTEMMDVFDIMSSPRQLPHRLPDQEVDIHVISFDAVCINSMLLRLGEQRKLS